MVTTMLARLLTFLVFLGRAIALFEEPGVASNVKGHLLWRPASQEGMTISDCEVYNYLTCVRKTFSCSKPQMVKCVHCGKKFHECCVTKGDKLEACEHVSTPSQEITEWDLVEPLTSLYTEKNQYILPQLFRLFQTNKGLADTKGLYQDCNDYTQLNQLTYHINQTQEVTFESVEKDQNVSFTAVDRTNQIKVMIQNIRGNTIAMLAKRVFTGFSRPLIHLTTVLQAQAQKNKRENAALVGAQKTQRKKLPEWLHLLRTVENIVALHKTQVFLLTIAHCQKIIENDGTKMGSMTLGSTLGQYLFQSNGSLPIVPITAQFIDNADELWEFFGDGPEMYLVHKLWK